MSNTVRSVASIAIGYAGFAIGAGISAAGGPLGFAIATVLFNVIVPPKTPNVDSGKGGSQNTTTAVNTGIYEVFGHGLRDGGEFLRCALDKDGNRSGIAVRTVTKGGGGSGKPGGGAASSEEKQFVRASFGICEGFTYIDKVIEVNSKVGEVVKYDRFGTVKGELQFTDVYGPVSGKLIAQLSETIRLYFGSEEQPVDSAESAWYPDGVSADRGLTKVVFNDYGPLESGTTFRFWLRNDLTGRTKIIETRLTRAGIPLSRVDLTSIPANLNDYGWYVEGQESARDLAEQVAAMSFHDLHFMATANGMVFTDIARANPTIVTISAEEMGAYMNTDGGGSIGSSSTQTIETGESKPRELALKCQNKDRNFKDDGVTIVWTQARGEAQTITLRTVTGIDTLFDFAEVTMRELQNVSGMCEVSLMPGRCQVAPGTVLDVPEETDKEPGGRRLLRVVSQKITPGGIIVNTCSPYDVAVYEAVLSPPVIVEPPPTAKNYGIPFAVWLDGVSLSTDMAASPYELLAIRNDNDTNEGNANTAEFGGATVSVDKGSVTSVNLPGVVGLLKTHYVYTDDDLYSFDYDTTLEIELNSGGSLSSTTEDAVLTDGANTLWLGGTYVAFTTAQAITPTTYHITGLMPGVAGSDYIRDVPIGARVVAVSSDTGAQLFSVAVVPWLVSNINRNLSYNSVCQGNTRLNNNGSVDCTANNMKMLAVNPGVVVGDLPDGGLLVKAFARSRDPETSANYWDGRQKVKHLDAFNYKLELFGATGNTVRLTRSQTFDSSELDFTLSAAEKTAIFGATMPAQVRGRITGENDFGDGFPRLFTSTYG